jgi:hypothetical protein
MAFHLWTLGLLAVVIIIYVVISRVGNRKEAVKGAVHMESGKVGASMRDDFGEWLFYSGKAFVYTFVMIGHLFKKLFGILKIFVSWYKGKSEDKVKRVPKGYLWCPRCQNYFHKSHACFKGAK